ncbi:UDP-N-acetylmuramyl peptide synthase [Bifidobacterium amazonense]|uniref:UDP-N-acetylmuramyl peptide synthase n=1 Tax=Bifidobacterium amazonense TaxID=2809027 RepID=A0ABS9VRF2_9BIFI|nr:UDP-N-acetylmuramyl peptide synthase [Bifidobacterium amazonense]MCH9274719.1 UDP-N-acetylmuramyl peptide synthase [Bifidobacterium amazonense]
MSSVSEAVARRMTLGYLTDHYGCELEPSFASNVTVTSLADDVDSVSAGALFVPREITDANPANLMEQALERGAYAALAPSDMRETLAGCELPILFGDLTDAQLGELATEMSGAPASMLAVFAVAGPAGGDVAANVSQLSRLLHMLGNPVSVIGSFGSQSLERQLALDYPLGIFDVQRTLGVCQEDGAAAVIVALDEGTFRDGALSGVNVDVLGVDGMDSDPRKGAIARADCERYGFVMDDQTHLIGRTGESDQIAMQFSPLADADMADVKRSSLAIAMVMAAGVRRNNIRNALRVNHDLNR